MDLSSYREDIDLRKIGISVSAHFNRVSGDSRTDNRMQVSLAFFDGGPSNFYDDFADEKWIQREHEVIYSDGNLETWELVKKSMVIPPQTQYVAIELKAMENIYNDVSGTEFDGHYADNVAMTIYRLNAYAGPDRTSCSNICNKVTFDGSRSNDPFGGEIVSYGWELIHRDNPVYDRTASGAKPEIIGLEPGIYDVTLTITNDFAEPIQSTDQMVLTVKDDCDPCLIMKGDLNADGNVDGLDLNIFSYHFGTQADSP